MDHLFEQRFSLARKLFEEKRYRDSNIIFDWLCEAYPTSSPALIGAARSSSYVYDYQAVARRFATLESTVDLPTKAWLAMARMSWRLRRPEWANKYEYNALTLGEPTADALGAFATSLERSGNVEQAIELVDRGLRIDSSNGTCQLLKAKLLRRRRSFDAAAALLQDFINRPATQVRFAISAHYEFAHLMDEVGDYAGAMSALIRAKQITIAQPEYFVRVRQAANADRIHDGLLRSLNSDYFRQAARWRPAEPRRFSLLGGHPRSGTTLLEQLLDSHSDVISIEETQVYARTVEPDVIRKLTGADIGRSVLAIPNDQIEQMRFSYFQIMEQVAGKSLLNLHLLEKNPGLTDNIAVFCRLFPECTYIIAIRDPRDVLISCFFQDFPLNNRTVRFQSMRDAALRYSHTMAMWLIARENISQDKWIEVRYESLVNNLPAEAGRIMSKLDLQIQPAQLQPDVHAKTKAVLSPTYADVTKPVHSSAIGKWKRYERWMAEAMPVLEPFIRAFNYTPMQA